VPYLDASAKATLAPWTAGLQLPLMHLDVSEAKAYLKAMDPQVCVWGGAPNRSAPKHRGRLLGAGFRGRQLPREAAALARLAHPSPPRELTSAPPAPVSPPLTLRCGSTFTRRHTRP
jgi:hypothetical protein